MKTFSTLCLWIGLFISMHAYSQTNIGGVISSNMVLTASNSPYIVTNNILVLPGIKLTIEPGVLVQFNPDLLMRIDGEIQAKGNIDSMITFTRNTGTWYG